MKASCLPLLVKEQEHRGGAVTTVCAISEHLHNNRPVYFHRLGKAFEPAEVKQLRSADDIDA